ncbi:MAG: glutamate 5-kinase [Acidobacteria bacterium]|nr:glutamate 5-kinase [Acidobacteriota bacterium]
MSRALPRVRRVVIKVGSTSLTAGGVDLDERQVAGLARQIAAARAGDVACVLVSSGAIAAGLGPLGFAGRPRDIPSLQAAASVGQGILMHAYRREFARRGVAVGQVLLTQDDFVRRGGYLHARRALERLLALGAVPIVNENDTVAVDEIRFGDNDRLAALVANMVRADLLVILSDVDGLYTTDPARRGATLIEEVADVSRLPKLRAGGSGLGSGGIASKVEAARIATTSGVGVVVANARRAGVLRAVLAGAPVGTHFPARRGRGSSRKLWIAYAQVSRGSILVDSGAREAIVKRGKSLLPAGVVGHRGSFSVGDAVEVLGPDGAAFAKGIVNYSAEEIPRIKGRSIRDGGREVIHRDSLVIL